MKLRYQKAALEVLAVLALVSAGVARADGPLPAGNSNPNPAPTQPGNPNTDNGSGEFDGGSNEMKFTRYSDDRIQLEIQDKVKIACKQDRCRLFTITNKSNAFTVEFNAGYGNPYNNTGGGSVVVVGTTPYYPQPQPYIGLTLRYVVGNCVEDVEVPESLYVSMNTYLYRLMNEDGSVRTNMSPAEQTMLMFYTTIMSQAKGCTPVTK